MRNAYLAFFALAVAFITIGFSGHRSFLYVGLVFLVISALRIFGRRV